MIPIKTQEEIEIMVEGGKRLVQVFGQVFKNVKPGVSLAQLDQLAETLIEKKGGKPSFKMVEGYHWATCLNLNQGVVHGIPNEYRLKNGDVLSVDMGMFYKGFHTDMAKTVEVRRTKDKGQSNDFLKVGKRALKEAVKVSKPGNRVGHISAAIEKEIKRSGFKPIRALTGHGVGKKLHEKPPIPCFLKGTIKETPLLRPGMALAIEVIYSQGKPEIILKKDGWTIETADGQLAALFEETIMITAKNPLNLTKLD